MTKNNQHKILAIVGPTATGKTKLAIALSQLSPSILISADSRQVYRGMDVVTGKDHPPGHPIIGLDLVEPNESCSVSVWYDAVIPHIERAWKQGKLPIVVGGTGLYVRALTDGISTLSVPINQSLRTKLESLTVLKLQSHLKTIAPTKFLSLNHSDVNNPRRLIRAIEVAEYSALHSPQPTSHQLPSTLIIGLRYNNISEYQKKVRDRVLARIQTGALAETERLLPTASPQALSGIGYRSLSAHLHSELSYDQMINNWVADECSYAKRQLTYFNKMPNLIWHDPTSSNFAKLASVVKAWYDKATK